MGGNDGSDPILDDHAGPGSIATTEEYVSVTSLSKKVCLLGDYAVGKTSLVRRFVYNLFDDKYISTIGVRVSRKTVVVPLDQRVVELKVMLWDLAGSEEFDRVRASYLRGTAGAVLVCDLTRLETVDSLGSYVEALHSISPLAALAIAANKCDLVDAEVNPPAQIKALARELEAPVFYTSAKTGSEVDQVFRRLGARMVS